jgi:hypothetical protein
VDLFWAGDIPTALAAAGSIAWIIGLALLLVAFAERRGRVLAVLLGICALALTGWGVANDAPGSLPWWIGVLAIALVAFLAVRPRLIASMLLLAAMLFGTSHVVPYGPLGMACLLTAAIAIESTRGSRGAP